jgi:hypothetical protein
VRRRESTGGGDARHETRGELGPDAASAFEAVVAAFSRDRSVEPPSPKRSSFGSNGLRVDGRIFAMLVRADLVVKLPGPRVAELIETGRGEPFDAGKGRPMKEWVVVRSAPSTWVDLAQEARRYVGRSGPRQKRGH